MRYFVRHTCINFYPRSPRGGRQRSSQFHLLSSEFLSTLSARRATTTEDAAVAFIKFLSTLSARRATAASACPTIYGQFLSTLSARRATMYSATFLSFSAYFYPRSPRGGRLFQQVTGSFAQGFLSTPSARRATNSPQFTPFTTQISIHALREEGDCSLPV